MSPRFLGPALAALALLGVAALAGAPAASFVQTARALAPAHEAVGLLAGGLMALFWIRLND